MMAVRTAAFTAASLIAAAAAMLVAAPAIAQWVWKDDAGHVVASDQPPPASVPRSRILKEPKGRSATPQAPATPAPDAATRTDAPKSLADRELESKQRQKEAADAAKKSDDEAAKAKALQENCTAVRGNLAALQAGGRAARFDDKGEKYYLDDAQRAGEITKAQGQIGQYCK